MRRNVKIICMVGGCLVGCGVVLSLLGLAFGAKTSVTYSNGAWHVGNGGLGISYGLDNSYDAMGNIGQTAWSEGNNSRRSGEKVNSGLVALEAFEKIDIELNAIELDIIPSEAFGIELNYQSPEKVTYKVENNKLTVKQASRNYARSINGSEGQITVYIPSDIQLEEVVIDNGMGDAYIQNREIDVLEFNVGMGEVELENVTVQDLDLDGGMGDVVTKGLTSYKTNISVGMGEVDIEGSLEGNVTIDGGMGSVKLTTSRPFGYYNYVLEKGMGVITINNQEYSILENVRKDNDADYTIKVRGGMGEIEVNTAE